MGLMEIQLQQEIEHNPVTYTNGIREFINSKSACSREVAILTRSINESGFKNDSTTNRDLAMNIFITMSRYRDPCPIQVVAGQLANKVNSLNAFDGIGHMLELLVHLSKDTRVAIELTRVTYNNMYAPDDPSVHVRIKASFPRYESLLIQDTERHYPMPLLIKPKAMDSNKCVIGLDESNFTSAIRGKGVFHTKRISLDVLNIQNATKLELDSNVFNMYGEIYKETLVDKFGNVYNEYQLEDGQQQFRHFIS